MREKYNATLTTTARSLRKNQTKEERKLWYEFLKTYPVRFTRQKVIGHYIVDFYCAKANLVIELDGSQHFTEDGAEKDQQRNAYLKELGILVLHIPNNQFHHNFTDVCEYIDQTVKQRMTSLQ